MTWGPSSRHERRTPRGAQAGPQLRGASGASRPGQPQRQPLLGGRRCKGRQSVHGPALRSGSRRRARSEARCGRSLVPLREGSRHVERGHPRVGIGERRVRGADPVASGPASRRRRFARGVGGSGARARRDASSYAEPIGERHLAVRREDHAQHDASKMRAAPMPERRSKVVHDTEGPDNRCQSSSSSRSAVRAPVRFADSTSASEAPIASRPTGNTTRARSEAQIRSTFSKKVWQRGHCPAGGEDLAGAPFHALVVTPAVCPPATSVVRAVSEDENGPGVRERSRVRPSTRDSRLSAVRYAPALWVVGASNRCSTSAAARSKGGASGVDARSRWGLSRRGRIGRIPGRAVAPGGLAVVAVLSNPAQDAAGGSDGDPQQLRCRLHEQPQRRGEPFSPRVTHSARETRRSISGVLLDADEERSTKRSVRCRRRVASGRASPQLERPPSSG